MGVSDTSKPATVNSSQGALTDHRYAGAGRMIDPLDYGSCKKPDQQRTAETECSAEFDQRSEHCTGLMMNELVPSEHSANRPCVDIEVVQATDPKGNAVICNTGRSMNSGARRRAPHRRFLRQSSAQSQPSQ